MPVLEAMACGLPVVVTGGGPTDEFCPDGRRLADRRRPGSSTTSPTVAHLPTVGRPWTLEPDVDDLARILRELDADRAEVARRGAAARTRRRGLLLGRGGRRSTPSGCGPWRRAPLRPIADLSDPFPLPDPASRNLLATPAWLGQDRLADLLKAWSEAFSRGRPRLPVPAGGPRPRRRRALRGARAWRRSSGRHRPRRPGRHRRPGARPARRRRRPAAPRGRRLRAAARRLRGPRPLGPRGSASPVVEPTAEALRAWASLSRACLIQVVTHIRRKRDGHAFRKG